MVVEAVEIPEEVDNSVFDEMHAFAPCNLVRHWDNGEYVFDWLEVHVGPLKTRRAYTGDWIVKRPCGDCEVWKDEHVKEYFEEVEGDKETNS